MCHFLIVNTTQRSVDKAVEQQIIARLTKMVDLEEMPTIPRWIRRQVEKGEDARALVVANHLNTDPNSAWVGKIRMANDDDGTGATINQKSFVNSLKKYVFSSNNPLSNPEWDTMRPAILSNYWKAVVELLVDEQSLRLRSSLRPQVWICSTSFPPPSSRISPTNAILRRNDQETAPQGFRQSERRQCGYIGQGMVAARWRRLRSQLGGRSQTGHVTQPRDSCPGQCRHDIAVKVDRLRPLPNQKTKFAWSHHVTVPEQPGCYALVTIAAMFFTWDWLQPAFATGWGSSRRAREENARYPRRGVLVSLCSVHARRGRSD